MAAFVLAAAGCGSKKNASGTTTTTTTTETTATTTNTDTTTTTTSGTDTSAAAALGALASSGNCRSLAQLGAAFSSAFTGSSGDVQKEEQVLQDFVSKVPDDIKPDFQVIADAFKQIADAVKGYTPGSVPDPSVLAKLTALQSTLDQAKLAAAEQHIGTWAAANCHA
jgi:hypothetical protein